MTNKLSLIMYYFYVLYQFLVAVPILLVVTFLTAFITILGFPWPNSRFLHVVQMLWSRMCCWLLLLPIHVEGCENVDPHKSYVFVSNHQSMLDVFVIYGWLPNIFKWLMKQEIRKIPFVGTACLAAGHIFVDRANIRSSMESVRNVEKALQGGVSTVIFPEGTRTANGQVGRFRRGAIQIAFDLNLQIVPISLTGCYQAMNKHAWHVSWHPITMKIGQPIQLADLQLSVEDSIEYLRAKVEEGIVY